MTISFEGWYSTAGSTSCTECPSGSYCSSDNSTQCDSGYYSYAGQTSCTLCPGGYFCSNNALPVLCSSGSYSLNGSDSCTSCLVGYECPTSGLASPIPCNQGDYYMWLLLLLFV